MPEHPHLFLLVVVLPLCCNLKKPPSSLFSFPETGPKVPCHAKFSSKISLWVSAANPLSSLLVIHPKTPRHSQKVVRSLTSLDLFPDEQHFTKSVKLSNRKSSSMFCKNSTHFSHSLVSGINSSAVTQHGHRSAAF